MPVCLWPRGHPRPIDCYWHPRSNRLSPRPAPRQRTRGGHLATILTLTIPWPATMLHHGIKAIHQEHHNSERLSAVVDSAYLAFWVAVAHLSEPSGCLPLRGHLKAPNACGAFHLYEQPGRNTVVGNNNHGKSQWRRLLSHFLCRPACLRSCLGNIQYDVAALIRAELQRVYSWLVTLHRWNDDRQSACSTLGRRSCFLSCWQLPQGATCWRGIPPLCCRRQLAVRDGRRRDSTAGAQGCVQGALSRQLRRLARRLRVHVVVANALHAHNLCSAMSFTRPGGPCPAGHARAVCAGVLRRYPTLFNCS